MANADIQATTGGLEKTIVLIDPMALRRAAMRAFLDLWAQAGGPVEILDCSDADELDPETSLSSAMVILSTGSRTLRDPEFASLREKVLPLASRLPIVLICDNLCQEEIAWAFERGLRGYLPTDTEPRIAIHALTFLLNGGDFFPPAALSPDALHCSETKQLRDQGRTHPGSTADGAESRWEHFQWMPPIPMHVAAFGRYYSSRMPRRKVARNGSMR